MPSIAYRLARVAAGDAVCGISLYPVSAHDVVAGHALLRGVGGVLLDENGIALSYTTETNMTKVSQRCFGGAPSVCHELANREWDRVLGY
jgi:fructose-1,6-bisphosphatase/inositol monophosphatase family enzyme